MLIVFKSIESIILLSISSLVTFEAYPIQKVLKMINLSDLTWYGKCLSMLNSCFIVVLDCLFCSLKHLSEEKVATNDQTCSSFTCFAMNGNDRRLQEVGVDDLEIFLLALVAVVVTSQTVDDIVFQLDGTLQEQEDVKANIEDLLN